MAGRYTSRGIVLSTVKYGESSMVLQMLTEDVGRQSFMVQGIRSSKGRGSKMALLQPLFALEYEATKPTRGELHRLNQMQSGITLQRTPFDIRRSSIALFIAEVIYRLIRESEPNDQLFGFVWGSIEALDTIEEGVANFHLWFLSNLARLMGYSPGNDHRYGAWFDPREGLYTPFQPNISSALNPDNAVILRDFLECDVQHLGEIGLNRQQRVLFLDGLLAYLGYHLNIKESVESTKILRELF
ncbi:MAG: DNA repair protein RecO [Rikenellaceae bacterium]